MPQDEKEFNNNVKFMEAITESTSQLCLSYIVLRAYGISPDTGSKISQILSLATSLCSICFAFASVSTIQFRNAGNITKPVDYFSAPRVHGSNQDT